MEGGVAFAGSIDEKGSELRYDPALLKPGDARELAAELQRGIAWEQGTVRVFGKTYPEPRLTCYYGDPQLAYTYSGRTVQPRPWAECPAVRRLRELVERATGESFNTVLCNRYRSGQDTMGWHADNEAVYGPTPTIASVSLGAERDFDLREVNAPKRRLRVRLLSGSLLVMLGCTQQFWQHSVPRRKAVSEERINLTFRQVLSRPA